MHKCPEFSWYGINFHKNPGADTAPMADPNCPKRVFRYHATSCSVQSGGADQGEVNHCLGEHWSSGSEKIILCIPLFRVFF